MFSLSFTYAFRVPSASEGFPAPTMRETDIYLPARRYGPLFAAGAVRIAITGSEASWIWDAETQTLCWKHGREALKPGSRHELRLTIPDKKYWKAKPANIDLADSPLRWALAALLAALVVVFGVLVKR